MSNGTLYLGENAVSPSVASALVKYKAGENIEIAEDLSINATDTTYSAGVGITISEENIISAKPYVAGVDIEITEENIINSTAFSLPDPAGKEASILTTDGAGAYWEKPATFNLLDRKESDHILDDIRWLRADTFSWHSGDMYPAVYEHLISEMHIENLYAWQEEESRNRYTRSATPSVGDPVYSAAGSQISTVESVGTDYIVFNGTTCPRNSGGDILGTNAETGTVDDITTTFYRAADGHKICLPDQESNIIKLYNATSSGDYYILDIDNKRFKLPRKNKRKIVHSYKSGYSWYNLYSDGWVEQGGRSSAATTGATVATVTLPIPMKNNQYTLTGSKNDADSGSVGINIGTTRTTTQFTWSVAYSSSLTRSIMWRVEGYASPDIITDVAFIFEYYYVGEFNKTSIEQIANITSETLNAKVDSDFNNVSIAGTIMMAHSSMPSATNYTDFTLGASGEQYIMPADGWLFFSKVTSATNQYVSIDSVTVPGFKMTNQMVTTSANATTYLPVSKGDVVVVGYSAGGATNMFRLFHCNGAN